MKTLLIMIIALFSQLSLANQWQHINQNIDGYNVRLSYTMAWSPATYGTEGGSHEGLFYVDVYSQNSAFAESAEIFEATKEGRLIKVTTIKMKEDNSRHFYGKKDYASSYADHIWYKRNYIFRIVIDGKVLEGKFRI